MNDSSLPDLEAHLGFWLRRVSNAVSGSFARALQAEHVSVAEWVVLRSIHREPGITAGALAESTDMTRGAVSKVLDKLLAKGWISRTANPDDNRVQWLSLTRKGTRSLPKLAALADHNDASFFGCLDAEEQATLRRLLQRLTEAHRLRGAPID